MTSLALLSPEQRKSLQAGIPPGQTSLWEYWDIFQERYLEYGRSSVTVRNVRDALSFAMLRLGLLSLEQVNDSVALENALFAYKKSNSISNITYNTYLKNLNTYFMWLQKHRYISENNMPNVGRCKEEINEQYTLSEDQVKLIVGHVYSRQQSRLERFRNALFIQLLRYIGARPCELLALRYQDVRLVGGVYKITLQGRKQKGRLRYYLMDSVLRDAYEAYIAYRNDLRPNENMLFISSSKPSGWTEKGMRGLFKRLSHELGFRVTAYGFRHYVATKLNAKGLAIRDIQHHLGHTRATTTERYIERDGGLTARGMEVMGGL